MKLLVAALALFALATPAFAQDAAPAPTPDASMTPPAPDASTPAPTPDASTPPSAPMPDTSAPTAPTATTANAPAAAPTGADLPKCGPGVTDRCQQSDRAQRMLAASEYKGGGKDNEAMGVGGGTGKAKKIMHKRRKSM